jgi:hypothetical protein
MFTDAQRKQGLEVKEQKRKDGELLYHGWHNDDKNYWKELCSKYGVRSPVWYLPADATGIRKTLNKLGKDSLWFKNWTGFTSAQEHVDANPLMPRYAFLGMALEQIESERTVGCHDQDSTISA